MDRHHFHFIAIDGNCINGLIVLLLLLLSGCNSTDKTPENEPSQGMTMLTDGTKVDSALLVRLGELIYHDTSLSSPAGQSCASCHDVNSGFDEPDDMYPTSMGADGISFGTRNSPTASYSAYIPKFSFGEKSTLGPNGGLFLDGRVDSLQAQAKGPFLNPVEMGNVSAGDVIDKIAATSYAVEFELLFGEHILTDVDRAFDYVADAIAAFERTPLFSPFSSKFDQVQAGTASFSVAEQRGLDIFNNKGGCKRCHASSPVNELFSDFSYKNIGAPSNPLLIAMIDDPTFIDLGLAVVTQNPHHQGLFRVPTLRNIAITAPYMHNGVFTTLREVIDFYNVRDSTFNGVPEVAANLDEAENMGNLALTEEEINNLLAFLETLTDE